MNRENLYCGKILGKENTAFAKPQNKLNNNRRALQTLSSNYTNLKQESQCQYGKNKNKQAAVESIEVKKICDVKLKTILKKNTAGSDKSKLFQIEQLCTKKDEIKKELKVKKSVTFADGSRPETNRNLQAQITVSSNFKVYQKDNIEFNFNSLEKFLELDEIKALQYDCSEKFNYAKTKDLIQSGIEIEMNNENDFVDAQQFFDNFLDDERCHLVEKLKRQQANQKKIVQVLPVVRRSGIYSSLAIKKPAQKRTLIKGKTAPIDQPGKY